MKRKVGYLVIIIICVIVGLKKCIIGIKDKMKNVSYFELLMLG